MRVVKEFTKDNIRISIFSWNNKYIIKFEEGLLEQTFKISAYDLLEENDLEKFIAGFFFESVQNRFKEMQETFQKQIENL